MKTFKTTKTKLSLLTGLVVLTGASYSQAQVPLVFGTTYVSAGANAEFGGDIVANTYFVGGASTTVTGGIQTGTAITLGASSGVSGETDSGTATTLGATVVVTGIPNYGTAFTLGAGATTPTPTNNAPTGMNYSSGQVNAAQGYYNRLDNVLDKRPSGLDTRNWLESTMSSDITLGPITSAVEGNVLLSSDGVNTYVYNAASLTTGAGITLTLEGGNHYVFNISDMLSLGAGTTIEMDNSCGGCTGGSVTWNMGGYASVGAKAKMIGTVFANGYVSTGVDSVIGNAADSSSVGTATYAGGLFSATSYVTIGASGKVGVAP